MLLSFPDEVLCRGAHEDAAGMCEGRNAERRRLGGGCCEGKTSHLFQEGWVAWRVEGGDSWAKVGVDAVGGGSVEI
jgi:hypothetical protein